MFNWCDYELLENCTDSDKYFNYYGSDDDKTVLDLKDDAANVNMGGNWHMPSKEQFNELIANTNSTWENNYNGSGINGRLFISKSDESKKLFIPASGFLNDGYPVTYVGDEFDIWGNSIDTSYSSLDYGIELYSDSDSDGSVVSKNYRCYGTCVRGVLN